MSNKAFVVVPWVHIQERDMFLAEWGAPDLPDYLILQQDTDKAGCGATKNAGIRNALKRGAEIVVVLDGDCYPTDEARTLPELIEKHCAALLPQPVELYETVTEPPSRGTPYFETSVTLPVAASMGFWLEVGDYCAVRQLAFDKQPMTHKRKTVYGRYFSLCGMNLAFKPREWLPWCDFIDVPRFDDIWMGWLWQWEAYRRGYCFNLNGPLVRHSRQSNVWKNLRAEAEHLEANETLWREIALHKDVEWRDVALRKESDYQTLRGLLPV